MILVSQPLNTRSLNERPSKMHLQPQGIWSWNSWSLGNSTYLKSLSWQTLETVQTRCQQFDELTRDSTPRFVQCINSIWLSRFCSDWCLFWQHFLSRYVVVSKHLTHVFRRPQSPCSQSKSPIPLPYLFGWQAFLYRLREFEKRP